MRKPNFFHWNTSIWFNASIQLLLLKIHNASVLYWPHVHRFDSILFVICTFFFHEANHFNSFCVTECPMEFEFLFVLSKLFFVLRSVWSLSLQLSFNFKDLITFKCQHYLIITFSIINLISMKIKSITFDTKIKDSYSYKFIF